MYDGWAKVIVCQAYPYFTGYNVLHSEEMAVEKKIKARGNKKYKSSIKKKLNVTFVSIIVLMCILNGGLVFSCFDYMNQYNSILDRITFANTINGILESVDVEMREIVAGLRLFENSKQTEILEEVDSKLQIILEGSQTEEIQLQVEMIRRTMQTLKNQIHKIGEQILQGKKVEEQLRTLEYIENITMIIDEEIETLIYYELKNGEQLKQEIRSSFIKTIIMNMIVLFCLTLFSLLSAWFISNSISKPLMHLYGNVSSIAAGDLTVQKVQVNTKNEIGLLAAAFNEMVKHLRQIIQSVGYISDKVYLSSQQLHQSMDANSQASEDIACASQKIVEVIHTQNDELRDSVVQVENMSHVFRGLLKKSDEIMGNANESVQLAVEGHVHIENFITQLENVTKVIDDAANDIEGLNRQIQQMNKILKVIGEISSQTNLLALNASIEAARAGHIGKSFAVVAQEIKKLADESQLSAKHIKEIIDFAKQRAHQINEKMQRSVEQILLGNEKTKKAKDYFQRIQKANQSVANHVKDITKQIHAVGDNVDSVKGFMNHIRQMSDMSNAQVETISAMGQEEAANMEQVAGSTSLLFKLVNEMKESVKKFKI